MQMFPGADYMQYHSTVMVDDEYFSTDDYHYNNAFSRPSMQTRPDQHIPPPKPKGPIDYYNDDGHHYNNGPSMQARPDQWLPPPKPKGSLDYYNNSPSLQTRPDQWLPSPKPKGSLDYYNNSPSMQTRPDQWLPPPKPKGPLDYYNNGPGMQTRPDQWIPPQKPNYNGMQFYGDYDQNINNFKPGREDYNAQYSEAWYEKDKQNDTWLQYEKQQQNDTWYSKNGYSGHGKLKNGNKYSDSMSPDVETGYGAHQGSRMSMDKPDPVYSEQNKAPPVWCAKGIVD